MYWMVELIRPEASAQMNGTDISLKNVTFQYNDEKKVLNGVDLEIPAGTVTALAHLPAVVSQRFQSLSRASGMWMVEKLLSEEEILRNFLRVTLQMQLLMLRRIIIF